MTSEAIVIRDFLRNFASFIDADHDLIGHVAFALFTRDLQKFSARSLSEPNSQRESQISAFVEAGTTPMRVTSYKRDATDLLQTFAEFLLHDVVEQLEREAALKTPKWFWPRRRDAKGAQNVLQTEHLEIVLDRVLSKFQETHMSQTFTTHVNAPVGNIAQGSSDFSLNATVNVRMGDWVALASALHSAGLSDTQIQDLRVAVDEDKGQGIGVIGPHVKAWLSDLLALAATGAAQIGTNAVGSAIAPLVAKFLGVG